MQPETRFKLRVLRDLKKIVGCYVLKTQMRAQRGVPDIFICLRGRFVVVELKVDGEYPTDLQKVVLARVQAAGGLAFYTCPAMWDEHFKMLMGL